MTEEQRLIDVEWVKEASASYVAELEIYANDRNALLADITGTTNELKIPMTSLTARTVNNNRVAIITLGVEVSDTEKLNKLIKSIRKVDSVYDVHRQK